MMSFRELIELRTYEPHLIGEALAQRPRPPAYKKGEKMMIIACDHPARGALGAGNNPFAMGDRQELLQRCQEALSRPGVTGFLGTADLVEDLTLMGALDNKHVFGSMNRTGLQGARFEMDDRFNCYDVAGIQASGLDGGKVLLRVNYADVACAPTLEATGKAISDLAARNKIAMIEPFISSWIDDTIVNDLRSEAMIKAIAIASGLGNTSAYTWLKLPCVDNMEHVMKATSLPSLILGGKVDKELDVTMQKWAEALRLPQVKGLVIGRSLLFPPEGDITQAVDKAVSLL
ncbi:MAG: deoxyribose-phosphate aldolase [Actinomycetaceae bacterium]|nr:deoxyribose-phosphate aldolase [Actinomycetaceae bacterium]